MTPVASEAMLTRAREAQAAGTLLVEVSAVLGTEDGGADPQVLALPEGQGVWCFELDDDHADGDLGRLLEVGIVVPHPERGRPFLWVREQELGAGGDRGTL